VKWLDRLLDSRNAFFYLLAGYFLIQLIVRLSMPDSLDLDEAEQVYQSQWWLLGYGPQPPLYNWLQQLFIAVFGSQVLALSLFKNLLLFSTWSFLYLVARRILGANRLAALVTLSLVFIPQISWESQRDLSHSVLVTTLSILTIFQGIKLLDQPDLKNYLIFGLIVGLGCNAKYSYLLFVAALFLAAFSLEDIRKLLLRPALIPAALLALAICAPHWWWLFGNLDLAAESTISKLMRPADESFMTLRWQGVLSLLTASFQFIALFALVFGIFFLRKESRYSGERPLLERLILRYFIALLAIFLVFILFTGVNFIKDRWMQPLMLAAPLAAFLIWGRQSASGHHGYGLTALVFMMLIPFLLILRVVAIDLTGSPERLNLPYSEFVAEAFPGNKPAVVLTERVRTAGNIRLQMPDTRVLTAERPDMGDWVTPDDGEAWVIWNATGLEEIPEELAKALSQLEPQVHIAGVRYLDIPYHYSDNQIASFAVALLVPNLN
jgi:4-amino-4-deoxy-L-arabinose transferase-like glycosyltransferase